MPRMFGGRPLANLGPAAVLIAFFVTACDNTSSGPRSASPIQFSREVSLPDLQTQLTGPARVDVSVIPGTLTARRVEIQESDQLNSPARGRGRVTATTAERDNETNTQRAGHQEQGGEGRKRLQHGEGG